MGRVEEVIEKKAALILKVTHCWTCEGAQIKEGYKSVAWIIVFRAKIRQDA